MDSAPLGSTRISIIFYQTATHKVALSFEPVKTSTFFSYTSNRYYILKTC